MPNYCDNRIGFICDEANLGELKKLYAVLYNIFTTPYHCEYGFGNAWLGRVALEHGLDLYIILCKGEIRDVWDLDESATYFIIRTETHWRVTVELWDAVIKQYTGIRYVYISDETSGSAYINNDFDRICFPERYIIYASMSDSSYDELPPEYFTSKITVKELFDETYRFNNFKELQDFMTEITGKTFKSITYMNYYLRNAIAVYNEYHDGRGDNVVEIHEYAPEYKEE